MAVARVRSPEVPSSPKCGRPADVRHDARPSVFGTLVDIRDCLGTSYPEIQDACGKRLQVGRQETAA